MSCVKLEKDTNDKSDKITSQDVYFLNKEIGKVIHKARQFLDRSNKFFENYDELKQYHKLINELFTSKVKLLSMELTSLLSEANAVIKINISQTIKNEDKDKDKNKDKEFNKLSENIEDIKDILNNNSFSLKNEDIYTSINDYIPYTNIDTNDKNYLNDLIEKRVNETKLILKNGYEIINKNIDSSNFFRYLFCERVGMLFNILDILFCKAKGIIDINKDEKYETDKRDENEKKELEILSKNIKNIENILFDDYDFLNCDDDNYSDED